MRALRTILPVLLASTGVLLVAPSPAGAAEKPEVSVSPSPTTKEGYRPECSDVIVQVSTSAGMVFARGGDLTVPLTVHYTTGGTAVPGEDYVALPGAITFDPGESLIDAPLVPLKTDETTHTALVTATLTPSADYQVSPIYTTGTARILVRHDNSEPLDCGIFFSDGFDIERSVAVGKSLAPLGVEEVEDQDGNGLQPGDVVVRVTDGVLPPGVSLLPSGAFTGSPTTTGTYSSVVLACRALDDTVCVESNLEITVTAAPTSSSSSSSTSATIPVTGSGTRSTGLLGGFVLALGLIALGVSLRRRVA